jgi:hypothetical protein
MLEMISGKIRILLAGFFLILVLVGLVSAASFSQSQTRVSSISPYSQNEIKDYWPQLDADRGTCEARQDLILQVSPGGCQPNVVRSDLLADQNVPVFCQVDAIKINPLIDIEKVRNIRFTGKYPENVVGVGFHPAKAALRSRENLLGSPVINNIGYVVVVLKREEVEDKLPDLVNLTLTATVEYESGNAFGIGKTEFKLKEQTDSEWESSKEEESFLNRQSFFSGKYFVRLNEANSKEAIVTLYEGDRKVSSARVEKGKKSGDLYLPGTFCQAAVQVQYDGFEADEDKAILEIGDGRGADRVDAYKGTRFLNDKCRVKSLNIGEESIGKVEIKCSGEEEFWLEIGESKGSSNSFIENRLGIGVYDQLFVGDEGVEIYLKDKKEVYSVNGNREFVEVGKVKEGRIELSDEFLEGSLASLSKLTDEGISEDLAGHLNFVWNREPGNLGGSTENKEYSFREIGEDNKNSDEINEKFNEAVSAYEKVVDEYSIERNIETKDIFGEIALSEAVNLGRQKEVYDEDVLRRLMEKYVKEYPNGRRVTEFEGELNRIVAYDFSKAVESIEVDNKYWTIRLIDLVPVGEGRKVSQAEFKILGEDTGIKIDFKDEKSVNVKESSLKKILFKEIIDNDKINVEVLCDSGDKDKKSERSDFDMKEGAVKNDVCGNTRLRLDSLKIHEVASIKLLPKVRGTKTETNLSVGIGIEKRSIQLSPERTKRMIENIGEDIERFEKINARLGKTVEGLKAACFVTAGVLTARNLVTGSGSKSIARKEVMNEWKDKCGSRVEKGEEFKTFTQCVSSKENKESIEKDIKRRADVINEVNDQVKAAQKDYTTGGILGDRVVETDDAVIKYLDFLNGDSSPIKDKSVLTGLNSGNVDIKDLRDLHYQSLLGEQEKIDGVTSNVEDKIKKIIGSINDKKDLAKKNVVTQDAATKHKVVVAKYGARPTETPRGTIGALVRNDKKVTFAGSDLKDAGELTKEELGDNTFAMIIAGTVSSTNSQGQTESKYEDHLVVFDKSGNKNIPRSIYKIESSGEGYSVGKLVYSKNSDKQVNGVESISSFMSQRSIIEFQDAGEFSNTFDPEYQKVRYFGSGVDRGFAAVVPFDINEGWYARVDSSSAVVNRIKAYDSSGLPKSWKICNVGPDGKIENGKDLCSGVIEGHSTDILILGLDKAKSRKLVTESRQALLDANRQRGNDVIQIGSNLKLRNGNPVTPFDAVNCQDFHSVDECNFLFNVCDPVICPASRCDLGGKYPVADVIQTGIIGSALLCAPNFGSPSEGGVAIPVCLTGIHAGLEGYLSILQSHKSCLQESLDSGRKIGICDQIQSIYLCDFFWQQISPVAKVILPTIAERAFGQGARGGGEYLTTMAAWENTKASVDFFTQSYAVNSLEAFQARSTDTVGTQICKGFVSQRYPTDFDSLLEPDSPVQFHAWFSETKFSDATVPATSQYKVFYHIFAGKDAGKQFSVYLKSGEASQFYSIPERVSVASGFIGIGETVSQTKDFTSPEGYKELCVNIDGDEQCGFGRVSTSFAVNQLSDGYVAGQIENSDIKTEEECILGSVDVRGLVTNPNLQAGVTEAVLPDLTKKGVVRVCSSTNPSKTTEPDRFVDVGTCGENLKCWLDKSSVEDAISQSNKGLLNQTLSELEDLQKLRNKDSERFDDTEVTNVKLTLLRDLVDGFDGELDKDKLIGEIRKSFDRASWNRHKAELLLLEGRVRAKIVMNLIKNGVGVKKAKVETESEASGDEKVNVEVYSVSTNGLLSSSTDLTGFKFNKIGDSGSVLSLNVQNKNINLAKIGSDGSLDWEGKGKREVLIIYDRIGERDVGVSKDEFEKSLNYLLSLNNVKKIEGAREFLGIDEGSKKIIRLPAGPDVTFETGGEPYFKLDKPYSNNKRVQLLYASGSKNGRETGISIKGKEIFYKDKILNDMKFESNQDIYKFTNVDSRVGNGQVEKKLAGFIKEFFVKENSIDVIISVYGEEVE